MKSNIILLCISSLLIAFAVMGALPDSMALPGILLMVLVFAAEQHRDDEAEDRAIRQRLREEQMVRASMDDAAFRMLLDGERLLRDMEGVEI